MIFLLLYSDTAMDTDEGEKEVPAKKAKTDPILVIQLLSMILQALKNDAVATCVYLKQTNLSQLIRMNKLINIP